MAKWILNTLWIKQLSFRLRIWEQGKEDLWDNHSKDLGKLSGTEQSCDIYQWSDCSCRNCSDQRIPVVIWDFSWMDVKFYASVNPVQCVWQAIYQARPKASNMRIQKRCCCDYQVLMMILFVKRLKGAWAEGLPIYQQTKKMRWKFLKGDKDGKSENINTGQSYFRIALVRRSPRFRWLFFLTFSDKCCSCWYRLKISLNCSTKAFPLKEECWREKIILHRDRSVFLFWIGRLFSSPKAEC